MLNEKGQVTLVDQKGQPLNASQRSMVWSDYAERMTTWLQSEMDTINGDMELLLDIHQDIYCAAGKCHPGLRARGL
ncbi:hypothetical protein [Shewanella chilikensis]|uniref:hypothetical protein n=1 Tax=Shewanella chilikensis TaxID=558541 RepID=UPI003A96ECD1